LRGIFCKPFWDFKNNAGATSKAGEVLERSGMQERRRIRRVALSRVAWFIDSVGRKSPGIVSNISSGGAQIQLLGGKLPERFTLSLEDGARPARIVWRRGWRLGVEFVAPDEAGGAG
jgi:hypothetical protein